MATQIPDQKRVGMVSLGCPKALVDSERILTRLRADGYAMSPDYEGADVVLVNTCGFLDSAKEESLQAIGEAIATMVLVFGVLSLGTSPWERNLGGEITDEWSWFAFGIAGLLWAIGIGLGGTTGFAINPARDLAPRILHSILPIPGKTHGDWGYAWVPVVGPIVGGTIGAILARAFGFC